MRRGGAPSDCGTRAQPLTAIAERAALLSLERVCEKGQPGARRLSMKRIEATSISASEVWTLNS